MSELFLLCNSLCNCTMGLHFGTRFSYNLAMTKKYSNRYVLETGIGLQDVDNLKNSQYFLKVSEKYLKGDISLDDLESIVSSYYQARPNETERTEEADKIAVRIAKLISDDSFSFTVGQYLSIHKVLFEGLFDEAGKTRRYNIAKSEWVLDGASVTYGDYRELEATLQYDFGMEKSFQYRKLSMDEIIEHLAVFIANLWQIHAFGEGNTRTTAVFVIKYLRSLGFDVTNDTFAKNAWFFRNALVRANYNNFEKGIFEDRSFLISFLRNLLLNENNELHNRALHVSYRKEIIPLSRDQRIIDLMRKDPHIKTQSIAETLGVSLRTAQSAITILEKNGSIRRENGKRYGYWVVL